MQLAALLISATLASAPPTAEETHAYLVYIDRVIDGDTVVGDISLGWGLWLLDQPIRLRACWAPELKEPGGPESKAHLENLLDFDPDTSVFDSGREVLMRSGAGKKLGAREKYGRVLGELFLDGVSMSGEQVRSGHATRAPKPKAVAVP